MKHKGLVRLLSVVAALLLPLGAMAQGAAVDLLAQAKTDGKEIVTTITFEPGATLAADPVVADLSAAAAIRLTKLPGGYGALTLSLSGVDSFVAQMRAQSDGLYVQSDTLGAKPLYITWADLQTFTEKNMQTSGMGDAGMGQFGQGFMTGMQSTLVNGVAAEGTDAPMTDEQIKQKITEAMGGDDSFVKWLETMEAKQVVTTGEFSIEGSDIADTQTQLTVTKEDMAALYDVPYIQKQIAAQLKEKDNTLTDEQTDAKLKETITDIKDAILKSDAQVPMTFLTKGEDKLVAMQVKGSGMYENVVNDVTTNADGTTSTKTTTTYVPFTFDMTYTTKAVADGEMHAFSLSGTQNEKQMFAAKGSATVTDKTAVATMTVTDEANQPKMLVDMTCDYTDAKHVFGELALTAFDTNNTAVLIGFDHAVGDATIDTKLSVSSGTSIDAVKADATAALLGTLKVNTLIQADSGYFTALKEATPDTSLQIAKQSEQELQTYVSSLQGSAIQTLYKIMGNLPPSVTALFFDNTAN